MEDQIQLIGPIAWHANQYVRLAFGAIPVISPKLGLFGWFLCRQPHLSIYQHMWSFPRVL